VPACAAGDSAGLKMKRRPHDSVNLLQGMAASVGLGELGRLQLSESQHKQVLAIQDQLRRDDWVVMGKMYDEMAALRNAMWPSERSHRAAILASCKRMSELSQQMLENSLDAADKVDAILTSDQRAQMRRSAFYCLSGAASDPPRKRPPNTASADPPGTRPWTSRRLR